MKTVLNSQRLLFEKIKTCGTVICNGWKPKPKPKPIPKTKMKTL